MTTRQPFSARRVALAAAGLPLVALAACSSGSASMTGGSSTAPAAPAASSASLAAGQPSGNAADDCTLVTAQELSQAAGAKYTAIQGSGTGTICNVTGASATDSFYYHVDKEDGTLNTWSSQVAVIKKDDGSETSVSGIGDKAVQGAVKEFAAESHGYIVVVVNADVNNQATASSFARTKKIEQLLISKL